MLDENTFNILDAGKKLRNKLLFDIVQDINYYSFFKAIFTNKDEEKKKLSILLKQCKL